MQILQFHSKETNTFIQQRAIQLFKNNTNKTVKTFIMLLKISISNQYCPLGLSTKILSSTTVFNIYNKNQNAFLSKQHIRMFSEGSCDTGVMAAENSAFFHILKHIQTENTYFKL